MSSISPKPPKIQLYSFVISSYLPLHECILPLDTRVSLASALRHLALLFERACRPSCLEERPSHRAQSGWVRSPPRREGRGGRARSDEAEGEEAGPAVGLRSGSRPSPMSRHAWELARWVAYMAVFTAVRAAKQSAGLWPGPGFVKMPTALISGGFQPVTQAGKAGDPNAHAQPVGWRREAWIPGQSQSLARCLAAGKGSVTKTSAWGHFKTRTVPPGCEGNVGTQFSKTGAQIFQSFIGIWIVRSSFETSPFDLIGVNCVFTMVRIPEHICSVHPCRSPWRVGAAREGRWRPGWTSAPRTARACWEKAKPE